MPPVREIRTSKDGALIEFSRPLAGLDPKDGSPKLLAFDKSDLRNVSRVDSRIASLGFQKLGVEVFRLPDPLSPLGWSLGVRDLPRAPPVDDDGTPVFPGKHDSPVFLDGFEGEDFGFYTTTVGTASVQSGTVIDGSFTGEFGTTGAQGQAQFLLYDQDRALLSDEKELFALFRFRLPALPASSTCGILNFSRTQSNAGAFCIKTDGSVIIVDGDSTEHDTTVNISTNTTYWGGFWLRVNSGSTGDIIAAIWNSSGTKLGDVTAEDVSTSISGADGGSIGAIASTTKVFADSLYVRTDDWPPGGVVSSALVSTANGTDDEWPTVFPAATNKYDDVDEVPTDDDTTYIETSGGAGATKQTFTHGGAVAVGGLGASDQPEAVVLWNRSKESSTIKRGKLRLTDGSGGNVQTPSTWKDNTSYEWTGPLIRDEDPDGGAWSGKAISDLDALEFGREKFATTFATSRLSTCVLQVYYTPSTLTFDAAPTPPDPPVAVRRVFVTSTV